MLFQKKSLTSILMIALIITIVGLLFFFFEKSSAKKYETLDAIPSSSCIFIQVKSIDQFYHSLDQNTIWSNLLLSQKLSEFKSQIQAFDSIFHLKSGAKKIIDEQEAIISIHPTPNQIKILLVAKLKGNLKKQFFRNIFNQLYGESFTTLRNTENGVTVYKLVFNQFERSFSYTFHGGLFIGSWNNELVLESVNQLKLEGNFKNNPTFKEVKNTAGKNVDANIFINYQQLPAFFNHLTNTQKKDGLNIFSNLTDWSGLDLLIKKDELLFSGFTSTSDSTNKYLNLFRNQEPQSFEMLKIIPSAVTLIHHFGIENMNHYFSGLQKFIIEQNSTESTLQKIENLDKVLKSDAEKSFILHIGSELALVSLATNASSFKDYSYAIIKSKNLQEIKSYLNKMATKNSGSKYIKNYLDHAIYKINIQGFLPLIFGSSFEVIQGFSYTFIDHFLIIANSSSAIEKYIRLYKNGTTLNLDSDFINFSDKMAEKSNYYFYFNINRGLNLLEYFASKNVYNFLLENASIIKNYQSFGLQFSQQENGLFTNFALNYKPHTKSKNDGVWQADLENEISGKLYHVNNHQNKNLFTIATDTQHQIYLFNHEGDRLWKHKMDGPLQSNIYEVDFYKNGKIQYLFNTKNSLYLIDVLGNSVSGYPHKLNVPATNGIALFDYSNNRDYRIVYAGTDKKIYNYNISGEEVSGWAQSSTTTFVKSEIQHLVGNNRDYILLADEQGTTRILSRLGKDRILFKTKFSKAKNSKFYVNSTNKKGLFLTTNSRGKLTYIASNGSLQYSDFGEYSANHFFIYEDFDHDGHKDFIYLDGKTLKIFNRFKAEILHHDFTSVIKTPPTIFKGTDGNCVLGVYSSTDQKINLFNKNGPIESAENIIGNTNFSITDILKNGSINLLIGSDKSIKNYFIK